MVRLGELAIEAIRAGHEVAEEEAERLLEEMRVKVLEIDVQLGLGIRKHPDGREFTAAEYRDWRRRAIMARNNMTTRYRELKEWLKRERARARAERMQWLGESHGTDPLWLLAQLHSRFSRRIAQEYFEPTDEEQALLDAVGAWRDAYDRGMVKKTG